MSMEQARQLPEDGDGYPGQFMDIEGDVDQIRNPE